MTAELVEASRRVAAYWARAMPWLADELESTTIAAAGEAVTRHDPDGMPLNRYAVHIMHQRCRDLRRQWVLSRGGVPRSKTLFWLRSATSYDGIDYEDNHLDFPGPPYDDTRWLLANLLQAVDDAHAGGLVSAKAREAVLLWLETESQKEVAARLGVTPSRVSQLVHEVIDAVREIGVAS